MEIFSPGKKYTFRNIREDEKFLTSIITKSKTFFFFFFEGYFAQKDIIILLIIKGSFGIDFEKMINTKQFNEKIIHV